MALKGYLTEAQAVGIISGATNAQGTSTRARVQVFVSYTGAMVYIEEGDFCGWLASTRKPSAARSFRTLDAACKAAASLINQGCPGLALKSRHEAHYSVEVICDRSYIEGKA